MAATASTLVVFGSIRCSSRFLHIPHPPTTGVPKPATTTTWRKLQAQQQPRGFGSSTPNPNNDKSKQQQEKPKAEANKEEDEIPQVVIERIAVRIVASVVMPTGLGLGLLFVFGALRDQNVWDVPVWIPVATSLLTFGASALGIAYGSLSSSWDPDTKGSLLGIEQLERNWVELWKE